MKKILLVLITLLALTSCKSAAKYATPFETGGKTYNVALLPWKTDTMDFTTKYRWTMTQAIKDACKQAETVKFAWSAYPVNGGDVPLLEGIDTEKLWIRKQYGRYVPNIDDVLKILSKTDADCALLYDMSADNGGPVNEGSSYSRSDYIRLYLVDAKSGKMTIKFIRTDFRRGKAFGSAKKITLLTLSEWLFPTPVESVEPEAAK
ncbi:hypothetical protein [Maridesulfovibrio frigidus]|uniref:hypothetical protein n=1 Tax=Maridesulfovibrio frigidus TaxID=340956 RepID=UPI000690C5FB|nr:hypothetical protein [Maridesulfovibrio frigidus]